MENNEKIKIMFICQGNICRSPMAMFILRDKIQKLGLGDKYEVISAALESSTSGEDMYRESKKMLDENNIPYIKHTAHKITLGEYLSMDYILVMEKYQKIEIKRFVSDSNFSKVHCLSEYSDEEDIQDPYYTRDFEKAYKDICLGIDGFLTKIILHK